MIRHKTQGPKSDIDDQKYELNGWDFGIDDQGGTKNLLKILQKKITFPILQNTKHEHIKYHKKLETLPAILEKTTPGSGEKKISKVQERKLSAIIKQIKGNTVSTEPVADLKRINSQKPKPLSIQCRRNQEQQTEIAKLIKNKKQKLNVFNSKHQTFFRSIQLKEQAALKPRTIEQIVKSKHSKIASMVTLPMHTKLPIFDYQQEQSPSKVHRQLKYKRQKHIKWDRFCSSQQKNGIKVEVNKQNSKMERRKQKLRQKSVKLKKIKQQNTSKVVWLEKMLQKNKHKSQPRFQNRILKNDMNDFMDDHLQSIETK